MGNALGAGLRLKDRDRRRGRRRGRRNCSFTPVPSRTCSAGVPNCPISSAAVQPSSSAERCRRRRSRVEEPQPARGRVAQAATNRVRARAERRMRSRCPPSRRQGQCCGSPDRAARRALSSQPGEFMPDPRLDVLCIGNAIVDVIANATDDFLERRGPVKGSMRLIDAEEAERLYCAHGPGASRSAAAPLATRRRASRRSAGARASSARSRRTSSASSTGTT